MEDFAVLHNKFASTRDLCQFKLQNEDAFLYLLVRSLGKQQLITLCRQSKINQIPKTQEELYRCVYNLRIPEIDLISFIRTEYTKIQRPDEETLSKLEQLLESFTTIRCGLRNDQIDEEISRLVRDGTIDTRPRLESRLDQLAGKVKDYALWSYFNQVTNDQIESIVKEHPRVVPTLRRIPFVDFFLDTGEGYEPFDFKVTHIADDFFDQYSSGLEHSDLLESFRLGNDRSELQILRSIYKELKKKYGLPNMSGLKKQDLVQNIETLMLPSCPLAEIFAKRADMISRIERDATPLEYWNYKEQGPRLFCNNNRFFVFLAHRNSLTEGRDLKKRFRDIGRRVLTTLDNLSNDAMQAINYYYDKEKSFSGYYQSTATSVVYTD